MACRRVLTGKSSFHAAGLERETQGPAGREAISIHALRRSARAWKANCSREGMSRRDDRFLAGGAAIADFFLGAASGVCVLVLLYFVYYYGWTGERRFTDWAGILLYYGGPAAAAVLLLSLRRLAPSRRSNVALALSAGAATAWTVEIAGTVWFSLLSVTVAEGRRETARAAESAGVAFDTRSPIEVIRDLRSQGVDAVPIVSVMEEGDDGTLRPVFSIDGAEVLPLAAISHRRAVVCNENGEYLTYVTDRYGFHNPPGLWEPGEVDVVALGDSYVQGFCVPPHANFVAGIRETYPGTLNLGMQGKGPLFMLATLKEYAADRRPEIVLWFYYEGNDLEDLRRERRLEILRKYLTEGFTQDLIHRQPAIDGLLGEAAESFLGRSPFSSRLEEIGRATVSLARSPERLVRVLKLSELRRRLGLARGHFAVPEKVGGLPSDTEKVREMRELTSLLGRILAEAKKSTGEWGGRLYFVYLPTWSRYATAPSPYRDWVLEGVADAGIPIIDVVEAFEAHGDPLSLFPFRRPLHYNEAGHRLVADAVLRTISIDEPISRASPVPDRPDR